MTHRHPAPRVLCLAASPSRGNALETLVRTTLPAATVTCSTGTGTVGLAHDLVIVGGALVSPASTTEVNLSADAPAPGLEAVRRVRAGGFAGPVLVVTDEHSPLDPGEAEGEMARLGGRVISEARLAASILEAELARVGALGDDPDAASLMAQVARTQQVLAAGEIALGLQHALNNPLAAILAESQLLEMDPLPDDQRQAVGRIVALCRRMIGIVRRLDGVGAASSGARLPASER